MPGQFWFSGNTATYAVQAAMLMGFTDIRLLGVDLTYDIPGEKESHSFGSGKREGCRLSDVSLILKVFGRIMKDCEREGISLVNESWVRGPLDKVMPWRESEWLTKAN